MSPVRHPEPFLASSFSRAQILTGSMEQGPGSGLGNENPGPWCEGSGTRTRLACREARPQAAREEKRVPTLSCRQARPRGLCYPGHRRRPRAVWAPRTGPSVATGRQRPRSARARESVCLTGGPPPAGVGSRARQHESFLRGLGRRQEEAQRPDGAEPDERRRAAGRTMQVSRVVRGLQTARPPLKSILSPRSSARRPQINKSAPRNDLPIRHKAYKNRNVLSVPI